MRMQFNPDEVKDYAGAKDFSPLPTGNYEVVVKDVKGHTAKSGRNSLQLELVVRNDLDSVPNLANTNAKYHNRHVFLDLWQRQDGFNVKDIQSLLYQAGFNQPELDFPTDFIGFMRGKPFKTYIKKEEDTYNGKPITRNQVAPYNMIKTDFPNVQHQWSDVQAQPSSQGGAGININFGNQANPNQANPNQFSQPQPDPFTNNMNDDTNKYISDDDLPF